MTIYSHSRIGCFEQCPLKYKLKYIDKLESKTEESIEAFLGIRAHNTLEKLYRDLQNEKEDSLEELLEFLNNEWEKCWNDSIQIIKKEYKQEHYLKKAEKMITDYYNKYKPFNQDKTIGLEERVLIHLDEDDNYILQGYIDRLVETRDGFYEIHDYKTSARLSRKKELDRDRQLALYSIGIKNDFPDYQDIELVWHFLAFDKELRSKRNENELNQLKNDTIKLIDQIENTERFPSNPTGLCNWCEYQPICNEWAHLYKLENKPANIYLNDPGVKLVNNYAEIQKRKKKIIDEIDNQLAQIKEAIITLAQNEKFDVVYGSNHKIKVRIIEKTSYPLKKDDKRIELNDVIKDAGRWDEISELDVHALNRKISEGILPQDLVRKIEKFQTVKQVKNIYISKFKGKEK